MPRKPDTPCAVCGTLLWSSRTSLPAGRRVCRSCRKVKSVPYGRREDSAYISRDCPVCGEQFTPSAARVRTCSRACGQILRQGDPTPESRATLSLSRDERERLRWQVKNRRRRALKRSAKSEPYTLAEIAARDKYRCQLCRRKVDMSLKAPHRRSPTIDHVIPIVEGGDDVRANVQLAHWGCNSSKGARGSQQLALVG
jgi:5-methylcytosine-specific restriction endonuclease McrA